MICFDGVHILNYPNWAGGIPKWFEQPIPLPAGCHSLRFDVHDEQGRATGLDATVDLIGEGLITDECSKCGSCSMPLSGALMSGTPDLSVVQSTGLKVTPNPSSGTITVEYRLARTEETRLEIYTAAGELVMMLHAEEQAAGEYRRSYTPENLPDGFYLLRLATGENQHLAAFHLRK